MAIDTILEQVESLYVGYFGRLAGDGDAAGGEPAGRGAATGDLSNEPAFGPAGEGDGFFSAMSEARSLSIWSIVDFAIR